jgi:uncharacterized protein YcbX
VVGTVAALARYPVKSMTGEQLTQAVIVERGVVGDRSWATYTADGSIGSGKRTSRFRRVDDLLSLRASLADDGVPRVTFPDGREHRADDPAAAEALSALLGQPLELRPEAAVSHHDDSPLHVVTTAALRRLEQLHGEPVDVARFRPNVVLDVDGVGFVEDDWHGRELALGDVVLRLGPATPRCVMVGLQQPPRGLPEDGRLLRTLGRVHDVEFGLQASVVRGGVVRVGDAAALL